MLALIIVDDDDKTMLMIIKYMRRIMLEAWAMKMTNTFTVQLGGEASN